MLDVLGGEVAVDAVAIAHSEQVHPQLAHQIGHQDVRVLVLFTNVTGDVPDAGCKCELRDAIESLSGIYDQVFGALMYLFF